jgi:hypothetical protein
MNDKKNNIIEQWLEEHGDPKIDKKVEKQLELEETLEEVAKEYYMNNIESGQGYFIAGAKWQAERMYTEEEVLELLHSRMVYTLGEEYKEKTTLEWFEQFKKK